MALILPEGPKVPQRTNGLVERMAREFRRFLRPREALRSSATAPALVALAVAQINARHPHEYTRLPAPGACAILAGRQGDRLWRKA